MNHKGGAYDATYVFSAEQQEEVQKIFQKYSSQKSGKHTPSEGETRMEQLRKLDRSVTKAGTIAALLAGILGAVIHGIGIVLVQSETIFALGAMISIFGLALFLAFYPIYSFAAKRQRRKVEAQILKLCKELMK